MSRDVKSTTLDGINDGLERGISRLKGQLIQEIRSSEQRALHLADQNARGIVNNAKREMYRNM